MRRTSLLLGLFPVLVFGAASRGASAQAATEYGLASGSSATSISSAGAVLNRKLDQPTSGKISHAGTTTVVHNPPPSGSKVRGATTKAAPSSTATATHHVTKQAEGSPAVARGVSPSGFTIVGAESASGGSSAVASSPKASSSGFTVLGSEPR